MPRARLPDPEPTIQDSIPDHPIHVFGEVRNDHHYLPDLCKPFRDPFTAPPHQWPPNAICWGLYEFYPSEDWPMLPKGDTFPSLIWDALRGAMRRSKDVAYPAFMYKSASFLSLVPGQRGLTFFLGCPAI
jgi:hypothetical protein